MKIYKLAVILSDAGWRKTISILDANETDKNFIVRMESGRRKFLKKDRSLEVELPIYPSHQRIGLHIFCREEQIPEAKAMILESMTYWINRIREEYTAMIDKVAAQPADWILFENYPPVIPEGGLNL